MNISRLTKRAFSVIGHEGSTRDGADFITKLWDKSNTAFGEVAALAKKDENGAPKGIWGLMSDMSRAFKPWENGLTEGLYLAGVEVEDGAEAPAGWTKWTAPASEYVVVKAEGDYGAALTEGLDYLKANGLSLVGAIYDRPDYSTGNPWLYFPIKRL